MCLIRGKINNIPVIIITISYLLNCKELGTKSESLTKSMMPTANNIVPIRSNNNSDTGIRMVFFWSKI